MATTNDPGTRRSRPTRRVDGPFRFSVEQFARLDELGFFEDRKVELIGGIIHEMTINTPHATATRLGNEVFRRIFGVGWIVSDALPLDVGEGSLLQPDFAVVAGSARDFRDAHPTTAALVVEISGSTLKRDRTIKAHLYAKAGVPEYWIVNLVDRQVEVHRQPGADPARRGRFRYASVTTVAESGRISPLAAPESEIAAADLLP
jgi:Uma2 family endonuclease